MCTQTCSTCGARWQAPADSKRTHCPLKGIKKVDNKGKGCSNAMDLEQWRVKEIRWAVSFNMDMINLCPWLGIKQLDAMIQEALAQ
jgi:hypothetical protein